MPEIIIVRNQRCEGCLYSANAAASNPLEGRKDIAAALPSIQELGFSVTAIGRRAHKSASICCRGFYDAHKEQLPAARLSKKKGAFGQWWKAKAKGSSFFINNPLEREVP